MTWAHTQRYRWPGERDSVAYLVVGDYLVASANGAYLSGDPTARARQWVRLEAMGCRPGASDLMLYIPTASYHGLSLEMKKRRELFRSEAEASAAVAATQTAYLRQLRRVGYRAEVAYGWEEGARTICRYLGWDPAQKGL